MTIVLSFFNAEIRTGSNEIPVTNRTGSSEAPAQSPAITNNITNVFGPSVKQVSTQINEQHVKIGIDAKIIQAVKRSIVAGDCKPTHRAIYALYRDQLKQSDIKPVLNALAQDNVVRVTSSGSFELVG